MTVDGSQFLNMKAENVRVTDKTWQQTKSENTRTAILDATLDCFYELGYGNTTTEKVAKQAGVSRGAMLHHFPSRKTLIRRGHASEPETLVAL